MGNIERDPTVLRPDKGCVGGPHLVGTRFESCIYCEAHMLDGEAQRLREAIRALEAEVARLREGLEQKNQIIVAKNRRLYALEHPTLGGQ